MKKERPDHQNSPYWDQQAKQFAADHFQEAIAQYKKREHLEMILSWYQPDRGARILKTDLFEEAHGRDSFLPELETRFRNIVAIDISAEVVRRVRDHFPGHHFFVSDVASLALPANHFDLIISTSTLDHLIPERFELALGELARVLKPGGCMIITLDNKHNPLHRVSHWLRKQWGWYYIDRCFAFQPTSKLLAKHGFQVTNRTAIYHIPFPLNLIAKKIKPLLGNRGYRILKKAIDLLAGLKRLPSRMLTGRYLALRQIFWAATGKVRIDYVDCLLALEDGEVYLYEALTEPAWRGRGLTPATSSACYRAFFHQGCLRALIAVLPENQASLATIKKLGPSHIGRLASIGWGRWRRCFYRPASGSHRPVTVTR